VGHVRQGRGGFGLTTRPPAWNRATASERKKLVVEEIHRLEEVARWTKAVSFGKQGQWTRWGGGAVAKRRISLIEKPLH